MNMNINRVGPLNNYKKKKLFFSSNIKTYDYWSMYLLNNKSNSKSHSDLNK